MANHTRFTPREDFRRLESQRISQSVSLSQRYQELKSLTVEFSYFTSTGFNQNHHIKYTVNPDFAKSVFCLDCLNGECVGGDFDLSEVLRKAVAVRQESVEGEMTCQGWLSRATIDQTRCNSVLKYKLSLEY